MLPGLRGAGGGQGDRHRPRHGTCTWGDRQILLRWRKRRWECQNQDCERKTFTESVPAVPPRARLTSRLRTRLGQAVGDDLMPAAAAARRYGVSDRTAARAFTAYADARLADLDAGQEPAEAAGIDEFRRGAPASAADPDTGEMTQTAPNGSPTWLTWEAAAASAWPRAAPPKRRRTCWPAMPGGCATWQWTCPPPTGPAPRPA